ncbi:MAG: hypothetical protein JXB36_18150 [Gammaproteobacteria bacterium]|nr:hypothetical protein [Gammaproteobacteria bacterium]
MDSIPTPPDPAAALRGPEPFTISDIGLVLGPLFFAPGDWLLWVMAAHAPRVANFLELSPADYGGWFSGFFSALIWLALLTLSAIAYRAVRDFDEALTCRIVQLYQDARRGMRVARNRIKFELRHVAAQREKRRRRIEPSLELHEGIDVSAMELKVLLAHAQLPPGRAMPIADIAAMIAVQKDQARRVVSRLKQLNLLAPTIGGADGDTAYTLTSAGVAFLMFRRGTSGSSPGGAPSERPRRREPVVPPAMRSPRPRQGVA